MNTSTIERRKAPGKRLGVFLLGLAVAAAGTFAFAGGQANAAEETITFDKGRVNLGFAFQNRDILPAPNNLGGTPLPNLWEAKATASTPTGQGTAPNNPTSFKPAGCITPVTFYVVSADPLVVAPNDGQSGRPGPTPNPSHPCTTANQPNGTAVVDVAEDGTFTGAANDFRFPIMIVPNPLDQSPVPITLAAPDGITGTISSAGDVRINGRMQVQVLTGLQTNPLGTYCALDLPGREPGGFGSSTAIPNDGFALTTGYALPAAQGFVGTPFASEAGLEGDGALVGTWNTTANSTSVGGANCDTVNGVSKGFGGIWLSSNIAEPGRINENTASCSTFDNRVGTFPACLTRAAFGKVTVKGPGKAKRNKRVTYTVRVPNTGEADATGVRVAVKGKGVKASASGGTIAGGAAKSVKVRVTAKKTGKVRMTFTVTGKGIAKKTATKTVTVGR